MAPGKCRLFGRGRLDHLALQAASIESFDEIRTRLLDRQATDGFVTEFGHILSLFFRDPDGLECEVCVPNPTLSPTSTTHRARPLVATTPRGRLRLHDTTTTRTSGMAAPLPDGQRRGDRDTSITRPEDLRSSCPWASTIEVSHMTG